MAKQRMESVDDDERRLADWSRASRANELEKRLRSKGTLSVPRPWKEGTQTRYVYRQQCYFRSFEYLMHPSRRFVDGALLVNGQSATAAGGGHAWVELPDGLVFDAVLQRWYPNYYGRGEDGQMAEAWYKYDAIAAQMISEQIHREERGPVLYRFDRWLVLPWGDPNDPLVIDATKAAELLADRPRRIAEREAKIQQFRHRVAERKEPAVDLV